MCQGLISNPTKVLETISNMTGGTASVDDRGRVTVACPDMSKMTLMDIRKAFVTTTIRPWEAMRVFD
jgi:hypothetical protein